MIADHVGVLEMHAGGPRAHTKQFGTKHVDEGIGEGGGEKAPNIPNAEEFVEEVEEEDEERQTGEGGGVE